MCTTNHQRGFTLIELIMVIVLMGIIAGMVTVFMKSPIDAYIASGRRAAMTDVADTVVRRMARDIQRALPNSIGTSGDNLCVEFIPTKTGGRYRVANDGALTPSGDFLDFSAADTSFNMLGSNLALPTDQQIKKDDVIVVYNLGIPGSDAYEQSNTAVVKDTPSPAGTASAPETAISITTSHSPAFPLESGSNRFQVVPKEENVVAYVCRNRNLYRIVGLTLTHICPATVTAVLPSISGASIMADNCLSSTFNYTGPDLQRNALVSMALTLKDSSGESVTLQHEVHVSNTP